jgi:uncharacterized repeat protein (TIGR01451 family)
MKPSLLFKLRRAQRRGHEIAPFAFRSWVALLGLWRLTLPCLIASAEDHEPSPSGNAPPAAPAHVVVRWSLPPEASVHIFTDQGWLDVTRRRVVGLSRGYLYLFRIELLHQDQRVRVYPSVELLRSVHVPPSVDPAEFPVPLSVHSTDLREIQRGGLVTKVVVLERPATAVPETFPATEPAEVNAPLKISVCEAAEEVGMPVLIMRVGSRAYEEGPPEGFTVGPVFWPGSAAEPPGSMEPPAAPGPSRDEAVAVGFRKHASLSAEALAGGVLPGRRSVTPRLPLNPITAPLGSTGPPSQVLGRLDYSYLCDGGDRFPPAGRDPLGLHVGLDPADAVGFYTTRGKMAKAAALPVCIYTPRYVAVRTVRFGVWGRYAVQTGDTKEVMGRAGLVGVSRSGERSGREEVALEEARLGPVVAVGPLTPLAVHQVRWLQARGRVDRASPLAAAVLEATLRGSQEPRLALWIQAAEVWRVREYPAYTAMTRSARILQGYGRAEQVVKVMEPPRAPGELLLWKVASKGDAQPGEVIDFAIYFKNIGQEPIEALSIVDSLPPRLEYLEGSAGSDRGAVFSVGPNEAGSSLLRWDIPGVLPPGAQGVVWFRARVR